MKGPLLDDSALKRSLRAVMVYSVLISVGPKGMKTPTARTTGDERGCAFARRSRQVRFRYWQRWRCCMGRSGPCRSRCRLGRIAAALMRVAEGARVFPKDTGPKAVQLSTRERDVLQ